MPPYSRIVCDIHPLCSKASLQVAMEEVRNRQEDRMYQIHTKRSPMAQSPSWTYSSGANPMGLSLQKYTGNQPIPGTDQYLHFRSHHPINHKTVVVRTPMDRKDTLVYIHGKRQGQGRATHLEQPCKSVATQSGSLKR